jgi:tRNA-specific 2-thiouridylase
VSKVVVGMSGGVDSSVAAALLVKAGHEVIGVSMRIGPEDLGIGGARRHSCYGAGEEEDIRDAEAVACSLGIPFHVIDLKQEYETEVLNYARQEYLTGRTPNPCVRCNRRIKFDALLEKSRDSGLDFQYFATGHYARVERDWHTGRYHLKRGKEHAKDQTYFLSALSQRQLAGSLFPLGDYTKQEVREIARDRGLATQAKMESQDFIDGGYASLLEEKGKPGPILDGNGRTLGEHRGIAYYTVGQRRGLGVAAREPLYVIAIDQPRNALVVGPEGAMYSKALIASRLNWISLERLEGPVTVKAKIRYAHDPAEAVLSVVEGTTARVQFSQPQRAVAPGQVVVFYDDETVLGSGVIERAGG